eukprot:1141707-Pelagomonas_calceolata.AAC.1
MCASHAQLVADLSSRLESLRVGGAKRNKLFACNMSMSFTDGLTTQSSTDPNDPVVLQLEDQLRALGPAPRRLAPVTPAQRAEALTHAAQRVSVGDVSVLWKYCRAWSVDRAHTTRGLRTRTDHALGDVSEGKRSLGPGHLRQLCKALALPECGWGWTEYRGDATL